MSADYGAGYGALMPQDQLDALQEEDDAPGPSPRRLCGVIPAWLFDSRTDEFHMLIGAVIGLNAIVCGLETDMGAEHFVGVEYIFCMIYIFEMNLRICQEGCIGYFSQISCWFDAVLVVTGTLDLFVFPLFLHGGGGNLQFLKIARLLRALRVLRVARLFKMFRGLAIILQAYANAFNAVLWVGTVIFIFDYILAVFCTQLVGHNAHQWPDDSQEHIVLWFGTIARSMRTLFIVMTLASWDVIAFTLMEVIPGYIIFPLACIYIMLASYTMVSLITGIISESLITAQNKDESNRLKELEESRKELATHLYELLAAMDHNQDGRLNRADVKEALENHPDIILKLQAYEINIDKAELMALIDRLTHADPSQVDEVEITHVRDAIMSMEGLAKAAAVQDLKHLVLSLGHDVVELHGIIKGTRQASPALSAPSQRQRDVARSASPDRGPGCLSGITGYGEERGVYEAQHRMMTLSSQMQKLDLKMEWHQKQVQNKLDFIASKLNGEYTGPLPEYPDYMSRERSRDQTIMRGNGMMNGDPSRRPDRSCMNPDWCGGRSSR